MMVVHSLIGKTLKVLVVVGILIAIATGGYLYYRTKAMERLYAEAVGQPDFYRGSRESQAAVRELASYRGQRSTEMLLYIASQQLVMAPEARTEAILALKDRDDPRIAVTLARLLQPYMDLEVRQAVGSALNSLPCNNDCALAIMHYLERIWRGEPNYEDRIPMPQHYEDIKSTLKETQEAMYDSLYSVLGREKLVTLTNLVSVYGLGSDVPSPFALGLTTRLGFSEACPYLLESNKKIQDSSPESYQTPRQEVRAALASLRCG